MPKEKKETKKKEETKEKKEREKGVNLKKKMKKEEKVNSRACRGIVAIAIVAIVAMIVSLIAFLAVFKKPEKAVPTETLAEEAILAPTEKPTVEEPTEEEVSEPEEGYLQKEIAEVQALVEELQEEENGTTEGTKPALAEDRRELFNELCKKAHQQLEKEEISLRQAELAKIAEEAATLLKEKEKDCAELDAETAKKWERIKKILDP